MINQDNSGLPQNPPMPNEPAKQPVTGKPHKKLYAAVGALVIIVIIVTSLISSGSFNLQPGPNIDNNVQDHMVYHTTTRLTNQMTNTTFTSPGTTNEQSYNSTLTLDIVGSNSQNYTIKESMTTSTLGNLPSFTLNVSKTHYYDSNFMAPGAPLIFNDTNTNPIIAAHLSNQTINAGDVWTVPINTGNASLGLSGELTLKFAAIEDLTVPAGTFRTMRIEITSGTLIMHSDGTSIIKIPTGMTLKLTGTSYLEVGTLRLIKADLTQLTTSNPTGVTQASTMYSEKTLIEHTQP